MDIQAELEPKPTDAVAPPPGKVVVVEPGGSGGNIKPREDAEGARGGYNKHESSDFVPASPTKPIDTLHVPRDEMHKAIERKR